MAGLLTQKVDADNHGIAEFIVLCADCRAFIFARSLQAFIERKSADVLIRGIIVPLYCVGLLSFPQLVSMIFLWY